MQAKVGGDVRRFLFTLMSEAAPGETQFDPFPRHLFMCVSARVDVAISLQPNGCELSTPVQAEVAISE